MVACKQDVYFPNDRCAGGCSITHRVLFLLQTTPSPINTCLSHHPNKQPPNKYPLFQCLMGIDQDYTSFYSYPLYSWCALLFFFARQTLPNWLTFILCGYAWYSKQRPYRLVVGPHLMYCPWNKRSYNCTWSIPLLQTFHCVQMYRHYCQNLPLSSSPRLHITTRYPWQR